MFSTGEEFPLEMSWSKLPYHCLFYFSSFIHLEMVKTHLLYVILLWPKVIWISQPKLIMIRCYVSIERRTGSSYIICVSNILDEIIRQNGQKCWFYGNMNRPSFKTNTAFFYRGR